MKRYCAICLFELPSDTPDLTPFVVAQVSANNTENIDEPSAQQDGSPGSVSIQDSNNDSLTNTRPPGLTHDDPERIAVSLTSVPIHGTSGNGSVEVLEANDDAENEWDSVSISSIASSSTWEDRLSDLEVPQHEETIITKHDLIEPPWERSKNGQARYTSHFILGELGASSERGCPVCMRLEVYIRAYSTIDCHGARCVLEWDFRDTAPSSGKRLTDKRFGTLLVSTSLAVGFTERTDHYMFWTDKAPKRPLLPSGDTGSEASMKLIAAWMESCLKDHTKCFKAESTALPRRVLFIGEEGPMRLIEPEPGHRARYACLSHRWGTDSVPLRLLSANVDMFKTEIPDHIVPPLFKDARYVASRLGVGYLWIDSLCIIQDSAEDWHREAACMASIYENAYITIAATAAEGSHDTLFRKHPPPPPAYIGHWKGQSVDILQGWMHITDLYPRTLLLDGKDSWKDCYPLLSRGWVFQERLLSPRVIHFAERELVWECGEYLNCECNVDQERDNMFTPKLSTGWAGASDGWYNSVEEFTVLDFTMPKDRLVSFAGVAKRFAAEKRGQYLAGIFQKQADVGLSWRLSLPSMSTVLLPRPSPRVAPTWSWASVQGPVDHRALLNFFEMDSSPTWEYSDFRLVSWNIRPVGPDEYGELDEASLTVCGSMVDATIHYSLRRNVPKITPSQIRKPEPPELAAVRDLIMPKMSLTARSFWVAVGGMEYPCNPDYALHKLGNDYVKSGTDIVLLCMARKDSPPPLQDSRLECLILRRVPGVQDVGNYQRIGWVELDINFTIEHWLTQITPRELVLV